MNKNKKSNYEYKGTPVDSQEEEWFYAWLEEAEAHGLVHEVIYQPHPFKLSEKVTYKVKKILKTKTKEVDKTLLHPHEYTPDFWFKYNKDVLGDVFKSENPNQERCQRALVDVKGAFNSNGGDRIFSMHQKWIWQRFGIYVNKVTIDKLFKNTWCPEYCRYTKVQKKPRAKFKGCKTIEQFLRDKRGV